MAPYYRLKYTKLDLTFDAVTSALSLHDSRRRQASRSTEVVVEEEGKISEEEEEKQAEGGDCDDTKLLMDTKCLMSSQFKPESV